MYIDMQSVYNNNLIPPPIWRKRKIQNISIKAVVHTKVKYERSRYGMRFIAITSRIMKILEYNKLGAKARIPIN